MPSTFEIVEQLLQVPLNELVACEGFGTAVPRLEARVTVILQFADLLPVNQEDLPKLILLMQEVENKCHEKYPLISNFAGKVAGKRETEKGP